MSMSSAVRARLHRGAALAAYVTILLFWVTTAASELSGSLEAVVFVKRAIPWGFLVLVPALAVAGATGFSMTGRSRAPRVRAKQRRMPFIAGNGLLVLLPAGIYLSHLAAQGSFGTAFYAVQAVELVAGALNVTLMSLNIRDGRRLAGRRSSVPGKRPARTR